MSAFIRQAKYHCRNCGEAIILSDDGTVWLHEVGYGWSPWCRPTRAEPIPGEGAP